MCKAWAAPWLQTLVRLRKKVVAESSGSGTPSGSGRVESSGRSELLSLRGLLCLSFDGNLKVICNTKRRLRLCGSPQPKWVKYTNTISRSQGVWIPHSSPLHFTCFCWCYGLFGPPSPFVRSIHPKGGSGKYIHFILNFRGSWAEQRVKSFCSESVNESCNWPDLEQSTRSSTKVFVFFPQPEQGSTFSCQEFHETRAESNHPIWRIQSGLLSADQLSRVSIHFPVKLQSDFLNI